MIFWLIISVMLLASASIAVFYLRRNWRVTLFILILFPTSALTIYLSSNRYQALQQYEFVQEKLTIARSEIQRFGQPKTLIYQLEEKIKNNPNDAQGWYFLGKLYLAAKELEKADHAFKKARQLTSIVKEN